MTIIGVLEVLGLVAVCFALSVVWRSANFRRHRARIGLSALLLLLAFDHLANILEAAGQSWADSIADHLSFGVPLFWGLLLLETGREYLSARLSASDAQLRFLLANVPTSITWLDGKGRLLAHSQTWSKLFGDVPVGTLLKDALPVPLPQLAAAIERCCAGEHRDAREESAEVDDERSRYFRWAVQSWNDPDSQEPGVLLTVEELTAERDAEARRLADAAALSRTQRLADVGQLAAGAAHDFNNFLQMIQAGISELEQSQDSRDETLAQMQAALDAAAAMTRAMLQLGGGDASARGELDLKAAVCEVQGPLSRALGRRYQLVTALPESETVSIWGNATRIQQALLNLTLNARDAMPRGGTIELLVSVEQGRALLCVRDSGVGMSEAVQRQLFTPFFTTKGSLGTGLGLRVVKSAVEEHDGHVSVESEPGAGTTFRLSFPLFDVQKKAAGSDSRSEHPQS